MFKQNGNTFERTQVDSDYAPIYGNKCYIMMLRS